MNNKLRNTIILLAVSLSISFVIVTQANKEPEWGILPDDLQVTVSGASELNGTIYFEMSNFVGKPNYMLQLDTTNNEIRAKQLSDFGMKYERHDNNITSAYEISMDKFADPTYSDDKTYIPFSTGGEMVIRDNDETILTISGFTDNHDLIIADGNYIYFSADIVPTYKDSTLTCLPDCMMLGQSVVEATAQGEIIHEYDLLDYYNQDDFVMDDMLSIGGTKLYDLTHANSIDLHNDILLVSVRHTNEVLAINRNDGTLVWRSNDLDIDDRFSHQHTATFTSDDTILLFDNGNGKDLEVSRAVEYRLTDSSLEKIWEYSTPDNHFAPNRGSAQRLENGYTLINWVSRNPNNIDLLNETNQVVLSITLPPAYASYQAQFWQDANLE